MHAVDGLEREFIEQAILNHPAATTSPFLGRLENQMDAASEIARFRKIARRPQQHSRVPVMSAAMHFALVFRAVAEGISFLHIESIHIGPQADRPAVVRLCPFKSRHDTSTAESAMHVVS